MTTVPERSPRIEHVGLFLVVLGAIAVWLVPIASSLWLDETATFWLSKAGPIQAVHRSLRFQGQSPLYFVLESVWLRIFGHSTATLRLPSVLLMGATVWFAYAVARDLLDRTAGLITAAVFASSAVVAFFAIDARPYALALMLSVASTHVFLGWTRQGGTTRGTAYALLLAGVVYADLLFGVIALAHLALVLSVPSRVKLRNAAIAWAGAAVVSAPLLSQILALWRKAPSLAWAPRPSLSDGAGLVAIPVLVWGAGLLLARLGRSQARGTHSLRGHAPFVIVWAASPIVVTFLIARLTDAHVFATRYFFVAAPGLAILIGWAFRNLPIPVFRVLASTALLIPALMSLPTTHTNEDWRAALAAVNRESTPATPVLMNTGYIEADEITWASDQRNVDFGLSPLAYYPIHGRPVLIPYAEKHLSQERIGTILSCVDELATGYARTSPKIIMLSNYVDPYFAELQTRLGSMGYSGRIAGVFGTIRVAVFQRSE